MTANEIGNSSFETPSKTSSAGPASSHSRIDDSPYYVFVALCIVVIGQSSIEQNCKNLSYFSGTTNLFCTLLKYLKYFGLFKGICIGSLIAFAYLRK